MNPSDAKLLLAVFGLWVVIVAILYYCWYQFYGWKCYMISTCYHVRTTIRMKRYERWRIAHLVITTIVVLVTGATIAIALFPLQHVV